MPAEERYATEKARKTGQLERTVDEPIRAGSLLWVFTDPHRGHELAYNRWYERDHYYGGCMIGAFHFAGSRWVATARHKDARPELGADMGFGRTDGSYACVYYYLDGHHDEILDWSTPQVHALYAEDRGFAPRTHYNTGTFRHRWRAYRDANPVPVELALDHRYGGMVALFVDPTDDDTERVDAFFESFLPEWMNGSLVASVSTWDTIPLLDTKPDFVPGSPSNARQLQLHFVEGDPLDMWDHELALIDALHDSGAGAVAFAAPFVPTDVGTDRYVDELWLDDTASE
jgi:hypothetical protein